MSENSFSRRDFVKKSFALAGLNILRDNPQSTRAQDPEAHTWNETIDTTFAGQVEQVLRAQESFLEKDPFAIHENYAGYSSLNFQTQYEPEKFGQPQLTLNPEQAIDLTGPFYFIVDVSNGSTSDTIRRGKFMGLNEIYPIVDFVPGNDDSGDKYIGFNLDAIPLGVTLHNYNDDNFGLLKAAVYHYAGLSHDKPWFGAGFAGFLNTDGTNIWERPADYPIESGLSHRLIDQYGGNEQGPLTLRQEVEDFSKSVGVGMVNIKTYPTQSIGDVRIQFDSLPPNIPPTQLSVDSVIGFGNVDIQIIQALKQHALSAAYNSNYPYILWRWDSGTAVSIPDIFPEMLGELIIPDSMNPDFLLTEDKEEVTSEDLARTPLINLNRIVVSGGIL